jgi:hypothetical protein
MTGMEGSPANTMGTCQKVGSRYLMYLRAPHSTRIESVPKTGGTKCPKNRWYPTSAFFLDVPLLVPTSRLPMGTSYYTFGGKCVSLSATTDTTKFLYWYCYKFPMNGGQGRCLLDVENDYRKSRLTLFMFCACCVCVEGIVGRQQVAAAEVEDCSSTCLILLYVGRRPT